MLLMHLNPVRLKKYKGKPGENVLTATARDRAGNESESSITAVRV